MHKSLRDASLGAMITDMSTSTEGVPLPQWDLADRLNKSLRHSSISVQQMADYLEVHRNTISAWLNGRGEPKKPQLISWAWATKLPYAWFRPGDQPPTNDGGPDGGLPIDPDPRLLLPRLDSNQQPFDQYLDINLPAASGM